LTLGVKRLTKNGDNLLYEHKVLNMHKIKENLGVVLINNSLQN